MPEQAEKIVRTAWIPHIGHKRFDGSWRVIRSTPRFARRASPKIRFLRCWSKSLRRARNTWTPPCGIFPASGYRLTKHGPFATRNRRERQAGAFRRWRVRWRCMDMGCHRPRHQTNSLLAHWSAGRRNGTGLHGRSGGPSRIARAHERWLRAVHSSHRCCLWKRDRLCDAHQDLR